VDLIKEIALTQDKFAIIDDENFEWLSSYRWQASKQGNAWYAVRWSSRRNGKRKLLYMHREILNTPAGMDTDHRDHNTLNNRQDNLRIASRLQNNQNQRKYEGSSRFKGVCWNRRSSKWFAYIQSEGQRIHLGCFDSEINAALAYDAAARKYFGEFACTNFENNRIRKEAEHGDSKISGNPGRRYRVER